MVFRFLLLSITIGSANILGLAQTSRALKIAILDQNENSSEFTEQFAQNLERDNVKLLDKDLTRAAATGAKIVNPFNLTLDEAKNLGILIDCNFFFVIKSETLRRSSFQKNVYFESYAIVFLISAQTGKLLSWTDKHFEANSPADSEKLLLTETRKVADEFAAKIIETAEQEHTTRASIPLEAVLIEDLPDEVVAAEQKLRIPLPFKRLRPAYTEAAERRGIEAIVDVAAELDERGNVRQTEIFRWAGFDLDEAVVMTVKKMQFRPALRDGKPLAVRILLRYNFRDLENNDE